MSYTTLFANTAMQTMAAGPVETAKQKMFSSRKGQMGGVDSLGPLALAIVSLAIIVGVGAIVLTEMKNTVNNSKAETVLSTGVDSLQTFSDFFTVIVVIGIAAVLFLLLSVVKRAGNNSMA